MPLLATRSEIVAETSQLRGPCVSHARAGCPEHDVKELGYQQHVPIFFR